MMSRKSGSFKWMKNLLLSRQCDQHADFVRLLVDQPLFNAELISVILGCHRRCRQTLLPRLNIWTMQAAFWLLMIHFMPQKTAQKRPALRAGSQFLPVTKIAAHGCNEYPQPSAGNKTHQRKIGLTREFIGLPAFV
ncbi:hypothetical protein V5799_034000 [Amblyomma americanum]|uniref:Uncharacterized protein n=1 Tax=Amblyomma americanum TaxID=6943 RepID=A0AAQ4DLQ2_AMBAM